MRFLRLLLLMVIAVPALGQQSWEGTWNGSSAQGRVVAVTVNSSNRIATATFGATTTGSGCSTTFDTTVTYTSGGPSVSSGGGFTVTVSAFPPNGSGFSMTGTLTTAGTGSGTATFNTTGSPPLGCTGSGSTTWTVSRQGGPPPVPTPTATTAGILVVVGSVQGAAFFRTEVQIHNPRATPISGKFVFHPQGTSGASTDPSMTYTLNGGQTIDYPDLLPAMGLSGLGSLDIVTSDPVPIMVARVFSDAGEAGTAGFTIDSVAPSAALQAGDSGVIIAPSDPVKARLNIGVRSLDTGASLFITVRNMSGATKTTLTKTYAANFFEQQSATALLGLTLDGSDTVTFTVNSGKAIIYGASTENKTQDPSLQYAKKTF